MGKPSLSVFMFSTFTPCLLQASPFFDRLVFNKIKGRLGGRVRIIVTGGAPLASHTEEFLKVAMCAPVVQGYGLTETCAASCIAWPDQVVSQGVSTMLPALPGALWCGLQPLPIWLTSWQQLPGS